MFEIEKFLSLDGYDTEVRKARRKGKNSTQEFYTPYEIVKRMCDKISDEDWSDPDKTFLEPCSGNFQFGCYIIYNRIAHGVGWRRALETLFTVELMEDNVQESRQRVHELLRNIAPEYDPEIAQKIMEHNFVCSNFFEWNFEEWRPMTEEEIKESKKKKNKNI